MKRAMIIGVILTILMSFSVFGELVVSNPPSLNVQPTLNADNLRVELEVKDASTPEFWVDVYLTSATHTQLNLANIKLVTSDINVAKFIASSEFHAPFNDFELIVGGNQDYAIIKHNSEPSVPITPGARTYLGRFKMQNSKTLGPEQALTSGTLLISLDVLSSNVRYDPFLAKSYVLRVVPVSPNFFCIPKLECSSSEVCGAADDGCGGLINCGVCGPGLGQVCVNNACVSAVVGLTPTDELFCKTAANFDSTDKALLEGVVNAINNNLDNNVNIVLDIFTALNAWFTAR